MRRQTPLAKEHVFGDWVASIFVKNNKKWKTELEQQPQNPEHYTSLMFVKRGIYFSPVNPSQGRTDKK